ncbi:glycerophosphodiester phosphodiesterase family protein [Domibacillus sp. DTU_2020_1001157_1_SI_ALB_TIR_016]|uniref:glycerophosphodiester phosphodiesterase family protein n=1 Tax=Domibacillus sp. DTU_2020_1001157_1_SI_ALB_TIR_016 TaxID=3077789 RepID=UPI0028F084BF|nr:glycerophosphodiester phosphodiesterase family protein [Domibacillus sp. DTU_2020_1001157_1_SI_ALB_TIR_016]WNS80878.1 glycerophosphodiester phosphodiesterase family protein [Domibacillus sp. DTU_2020_1001157_1_SI_ALB_TIR_016]
MKKKKIVPLFLASGFLLSANEWAPVQTLAAEPVLQESFDASSLPAGWEVIQGQASVQNGALVLSSPSSSKPARVLAPSSVSGGDYVIEADMTFLSAVEDTRWASIMYRVQGNDYPYYQMAVRRGAQALNGVEFALRNANNQWSVLNKAPYSEAFAYNKTYKLKIISKGNRVQQFINGQLVINTDAATSLQNGRIGFQASGATVQFDHIRITEQTEELPSLAESGAFLGDQPETNLLNAPTVISSVPQLQQMEGVSSMLLQPGADLKVKDVPLRTYLEEMAGKTIPVIRLEEAETAEKTAELLQELSIQDVHILSSQPDVLKVVRETVPSARGALLYNRSSLNNHDVNRFIQFIHASGAKTAVLPQKLLSADLVHEFHRRAVAVWGELEGASELDAHALIHAGVDGMIAGDTMPVTAAFSRYPENTLVQRPIVAAHRGIPSLAPENTMAGYRMAYELGADLIETDVQKTKDGEIVIMHDYTVDRTTNGTGNVKDLTLKELQSLDAGSYFSSQFVGERVPAFREFLQEFKGKNVILLVELKADGIAEDTIRIINEEGMADQVVLQSFHLNSVTQSVASAPHIPSGYLYSSSVPGGEAARLNDARSMLQYASRINATLNASYSSLSPEFTSYLRQRGMISFHWTFRNEADFGSQLQNGMIGPITDYTQWLTDAPIRIETPIQKRHLRVGQTAEIQSKAFLNYRTKKKENIETTLFSPHDGVAISGNTIQAVQTGTFYVFAQHTFNMLGQEWRIVSQPIEVVVK